MADVSRLLDTTIAGQIARKLDDKDGTTDDKIDASIWNKFVSDIGTGRTIGESISIVSAMNSITTYAVRLAAQACKAVDDLALEWLSSLGDEPQEVEPSEEGDESAEETGETGGIQRTPRETDEKYSTDDIKVTVPVKYMSSKAKAIIESRKEGAKLHDSLKKGDTKGLTPENVAMAFTSDVNFGPNSVKIAQKIYHLMFERLKQLGILKQEDVNLEYSNYKDLNKKLHTMRNRIVAAENEIIRKAQADKDKFNKDREKIQSQLDKANQLLVDIANNPKKAKIERGTNDKGVRWADATLPTGEWIEVKYDEKGEISKILISYDNVYDKPTDGSAVFDGAEVEYTAETAKISTEHNGKYNYNIDGKQYNFEKLKKIAEAIFGREN